MPVESAWIACVHRQQGGINSPSETRYRSSDSCESTIWPRVHLSLFQSLWCNAHYHSGSTGDKNIHLSELHSCFPAWSFNVKASDGIKRGDKYTYEYLHSPNFSHVNSFRHTYSFTPFSLSLPLSLPSPLLSCLLTTIPSFLFSPLWEENQLAGIMFSV